MTQHSASDGNDAHHLSSSAVIDILMRATRVMAVMGFVLGVYALSLATKTRDLEEAHSDSSAGNQR
jgi:preprotein translocase subunit SecG